MKCEFTYSDGGREAAGFKGDARDCVCRAIAIATGRPYREVYDKINELGKSERGSRSTARCGVFKRTSREVMEHFGLKWHPTMQFGQGCTTHLRADELPAGTIVVKCSKHFVAVIDGVIHDTHDPSRDGTRCVYGYWD
jgi:hypothetical protein